MDFLMMRQNELPKAIQFALTGIHLDFKDSKMSLEFSSQGFQLWSLSQSCPLMKLLQFFFVIAAVFLN